GRHRIRHVRRAHSARSVSAVYYYGCAACVRHRSAGGGRAVAANPQRIAGRRADHGALTGYTEDPRIVSAETSRRWGDALTPAADVGRFCSDSPPAQPASWHEAVRLSSPSPIRTSSTSRWGYAVSIATARPTPAPQPQFLRCTNACCVTPRSRAA